MFNSTILLAENGSGMSFLTSQLLQSFLLKDFPVVTSVDCGKSAFTVFDPRPDSDMVKAMHDICAKHGAPKTERSHALPCYRAYLKHANNIL
jgi:hypothetical protein